MSKGYPSMTALLGLLAVAGFQNRDKLAELFKTHAPHPLDTTRPPVVPAPARTGGSSTGGSSTLGNLASLLGGVSAGGAGGLIASGLGELIDHFTKGGHGETAKSWIDHGPNRDIPEEDLARAIGPETLDYLTQQTGLSRAALLSRLSRELPGAVDRYSPDGRLPLHG
ncbi:YidB family protein [Methylobacterium aerolatum]|uniref:Uncharacterized protein YidB (DUF937 family) n=1 Tax=Methylobacterium aerolatum TaxID=418708 RepID=A0ABU0I3U6_9HYPH|nr:YidB family protein [Methylobacterium aerolatum]MDQ0449284.1 uncharacterized protein YidB (DUF937 family) [Methylobacterium aerolatum]GJD35468.1 hypothetical protein FMGBMHLM_2378 [Methylobacterium aerolatum]